MKGPGLESLCFKKARYRDTFTRQIRLLFATIARRIPPTNSRHYSQTRAPRASWRNPNPISLTTCRLIHL
jgi:hypothetical protein